MHDDNKLCYKQKIGTEKEDYIEIIRMFINTWPEEFCLFLLQPSDFMNVKDIISGGEMFLVDMEYVVTLNVLCNISNVSLIKYNSFYISISHQFFWHIYMIQLKWQIRIIFHIYHGKARMQISSPVTPWLDPKTN